MSREEKYLENIAEARRLAQAVVNACNASERAQRRMGFVDMGALKWSENALEAMRKAWDKVF